jgi:hypothetical protein
MMLSFSPGCFDSLYPPGAAGLSPEPIAKLPRDRLQKIHGIGPNLASKLATLLDTGELPLLTELRQKFPPSLLQLKSLPGLGANRIKILAERLNIRSREDLKHAIEARSLAKLRSFGPKMQERLRNSLAVETVAPTTRSLWRDGSGRRSTSFARSSLFKSRTSRDGRWFSQKN